MKRIGIFSIIFHSIFLAFACMMFGVSFVGFIGEPLMIAAAVISLLAWGTFIGLTIYAMTLSVALIKENNIKLDACLIWSSKLFFTFAILSIVSAWVIGLGYFAACGPAWLAALFHFAGLVGSVVGFTVWFLYRYIVLSSIALSGGDYSRPMGWRRPLITGLVTYGLWGLIWILLGIWLSGPIDTTLYPNRASSPYKLPYPNGTTAWVVQGNNSLKNHNGASQFAWDFRLSCGVPVVAVRAGNVHNGFDGYTGYGLNEPNNFIEVDHGDGTIARYDHIEQGSICVNVNDSVAQGEKLAEVGNVGESMTGHIHFEVINASDGNSRAVSFQDVHDDDGIPRTFRCYTSGN